MNPSDNITDQIPMKGCSKMITVEGTKWEPIPCGTKVGFFQYFCDDCGKTGDWVVIAYPTGGGLLAAVERFETEEAAKQGADEYNYKELWVASFEYSPAGLLDARVAGSAGKPQPLLSAFYVADRAGYAAPTRRSATADRERRLMRYRQRHDCYISS